MARKQIEHLPTGYYWVPAGESKWQYTNQKGQTITTTQRHAIGPNGETLSVRQVQNQQRAERERIGQPKPQAIPRSGKTKTITQKQRGTKDLHGVVKTFVYRDIATLRADIRNNPDMLDGFSFAWLKVKYDAKLDDVDGSPPRRGRGYATLSTWEDVKTWEQFAGTNREPPNDPFGNPWVEVQKELHNYVVQSNNVRYYFQVYER